MEYTIEELLDHIKTTATRLVEIFGEESKDDVITKALLNEQIELMEHYTRKYELMKIEATYKYAYLDNSNTAGRTGCYRDENGFMYWFDKVSGAVFSIEDTKGNKWNVDGSVYITAEQQRRMKKITEEMDQKHSEEITLRAMRYFDEYLVTDFPGRWLSILADASETGGDSDGEGAHTA